MKLLRPVAIIAIVIAFSASPSNAYIVPNGFADWADFHAFGEDLDETGLIGVSLIVHETGTQYRSGRLLPKGGGGLGDSQACLFWRAVDQFEGTLEGYGCLELGENFTIDRLQGASVDDFVLTEVRNEEGDTIGHQGVTISVAFVARGAPYPGADAQTNPSPGVTGTTTIFRDAELRGSIESQPFGRVDLTGRTGLVAHSRCTGVLLREDRVDACRYFHGP